ncbi:SENP2 [Branchiostoma lanceolatum]|uniref:SENP2 protein n=1 Tax=Branchiostoma lanceolatum TaxID=7740 RepID=A0A8K0F1Y5_BRALA|nr:SENP2 [Branchiostoma lanceolatum]
MDIEDQQKAASWIKRPPPGVLLKDIKTLQDGEWLSAFVIEEYLKLVQKASSTENHKVEYFDCSAYSQLRSKSAFSSYRRRLKTKKDVAGSDVVFLPVHQSDHWGLLVFYPKKKTVLLLDSLSSSHLIKKKTALERSKALLTSYDLAPSGKKWDQWTFSAPDADEIPQQTNSDDCGVFVCQLMMSRIRKWMVLELSDGSIREHRVKVSTAAEEPTRRKRHRLSLSRSKKRHRSPPPLPENKHHSVRRSILSVLGKLKGESSFKLEEEDGSDTGNEADVSSNNISCM